MADIKEMQLGAISVAITIPVVDQDGNIVDISGASSKQILLKKPDKTVLTNTAAFVTDGTDGLLQYLTIADDIDQIGIWEAQADIVITGFDGPTVVSKFKVLRNIVCP